MPEYITREEFTEFEPLIVDGMDTLQAWHDPAPITTARRDASGSFVENATFTPIDIRMARSAEGQDIGESPVISITNVGTFRAYLPLDVQRDDRFTWHGAACVVTLVEPPKRGGYVRVNFRMLGGG